jgi:hypothetical protein
MQCTCIHPAAERLLAAPACNIFIIAFCEQFIYGKAILRGVRNLSVIWSAWLVLYASTATIVVTLAACDYLCTRQLAFGSSVLFCINPTTSPLSLDRLCRQDNEHAGW